MRRTHDGLSPNLPVQASVLDGFGDVFGLEGFSAGKGAGDFWDAVVSTGAVAGVLILRQRETDTERPFHVPLYPLPSLLFLGLAVWMLVASFQYKWQASIGSIILIAFIWTLKPLLAKGKPRSLSPE